MEKDAQVYSTKRKGVPLFFVYIISICTISGLGDFFIWPHITPYIASHPLLVLVDPIWKLSVWLLPTFLYIRYIENQDPITYLKLNTNIGRGIIWGLVISLITLVVILNNKYLLLHQPFHIHNPTLDELINQILLVGFLEEVPFRGFIFQKLQELFGFWWGAILAALIFVELHVAFWISLGKSPTTILSGAPTIFVFTLISCALLRLTRSLWSSIIFHSIYDFTSIFFQ